MDVTLLSGVVRNRKVWLYTMNSGCYCDILTIWNYSAVESLIDELSLMVLGNSCSEMLLKELWGERSLVDITPVDNRQTRTSLPYRKQSAVIEYDYIIYDPISAIVWDEILSPCYHKNYHSILFSSWNSTLTQCSASVMGALIDWCADWCSEILANSWYVDWHTDSRTDWYTEWYTGRQAQWLIYW